jgi:DNA-binding MarR family transcriptional regulator
MARAQGASGTASELRLVLGQLVRRLRVENSFPISQGVVLARLDREGPQTTSDLAAVERVRPQSMAQTVAELQAAGFVARRPHPLDRRRILIELTAEGQAALADDRRRREGWLAQAIETELSPEEQETLARAVPLIRRLGSV